MHFLLICMILISKWISLEVQFLKYKLHALISMGNLKFNFESWISTKYLETASDMCVIPRL